MKTFSYDAIINDITFEGKIGPHKLKSIESVDILLVKVNDHI